MTNVFWKPHEIDSVALAASEIFRNNDGKKTWRQSIIDAQYEVLLKERQRPEGSIKTWAKASIDDLRVRGAKLLAEKDEQNRKAAEEVETEPEFEQPSPNVSMATPKPMPDFMKQAIDEFTSEIALLFEDTLRDRLVGTIEKVFCSMHSEVQKRIANLVPLRHRRPKILIVGMLGRHEQKIHDDFDEYFEITFLEAGKIGQLKEKAAAKHHVIINTKYIGHTVQDIVRKHPGLIFAPGNNEVPEVLLNLAVRNQKEILS